MGEIEAAFDALNVGLEPPLVEPPTAALPTDQLEHVFDYVPVMRLPRGANLQAARAKLAEKRAMQLPRHGKIGKLAKAFDALARQWNKQNGLRRGDRSKSSQELVTSADRQREGKKWQHSNAWGFEDACRFAFRSMRAYSLRRSGTSANNVGHSTRGLDVMSAVSGMHFLAQKIKLDKFLDTSDGLGSMLVTSGWDATPVICAFGQLTSRISPHARYLVKKEDDRGRAFWATLPAEEFISSGRRALPRSGVVELLAQHACLHWVNADRTVSRQQVLVPPRIIQSSGASSLWAATERSGLDVERLNQLAQRMYVIISEVPDRASSNKRMMAEKSARLSDRVLYDRDACAVHTLHVILTKATDEKTMCGDIHALQFVCSLPSHSARMRQALHEFIDRTLVFVADGTEPDPKWARHRDAVFDHTLRRSTDVIRARRDSLFEAVGGRHAAVADQISKLSVLNGDIRKPFVEHYCSGPLCCKDRADCVRKVVAATSESGLLLDDRSRLPSVNRWGTMTCAMAPQTCGIMCHGVLPASILQCFRNWGAGDPGGEFEDDWRKMVKSKAARVRCVAGDATCCRNIAVVSFCSEPLDHVWHRVQAMDEEGAALKDVCMAKSSPFVQACAELASMLKPIEDGHPLMPLVWHFAPDPKSEAHHELLTQLRLMLTSMATQVWWRFVFEHSESWKVGLARMVDARTSPEDAARLARLCWHAPMCCKGPNFEAKATWLHFVNLVTVCIWLVLSS